MIVQITVGDDAETVSGLRARDVPAAVAEFDPVSVGVNCSLGPQAVLHGIEQMRSATTCP